MFKQRTYRESTKHTSPPPEHEAIGSRHTNLEPTDFASKWRQVRASKRKNKGGLRLGMLLVALVLLLICMYLINLKYS